MSSCQSGGVTVFVDQTTKDLAAPDGSVDVGTTDADVNDGWQLPQRAVRAVKVVVPLILGKDVSAQAARRRSASGPSIRGGLC